MSTPVIADIEYNAINQSFDEEPRCLYSTACATGSSLRKAISHIFGRNKLCTRMIPKAVWVHYCRKHYQRSRYQSKNEYVRVQCMLVRVQLDRLQRWSDDNQEAGRNGVVRSWSVSLRKREMDRHLNLAQQNGGGGNGNVDEETDVAILNGTAVPDWLRARCGDGYSTEEILDIVHDIQASIDAGEMTQIPDIELLPDITRGDEAARPGAGANRAATQADNEAAMNASLRSDADFALMAPRAGFIPQPTQPVITGFEHQGIPALVNSHHGPSGNEDGFHGSASVSDASSQDTVLSFGAGEGAIHNSPYRHQISPLPQASQPSTGPSILPSIQYLIEDPMVQMPPHSSVSPPTVHQAAINYNGFASQEEYAQHLAAMAQYQFVPNYPGSAYNHLGHLQGQGQQVMHGHNYSFAPPSMNGTHGSYLHHHSPVLNHAHVPGPSYPTAQGSSAWNIHS